MLSGDAWLRFFLRFEDYLRRNNYAVIRSAAKVAFSVLMRDYIKQLDAFALYLVNQHNPRRRKWIVHYALTLLKRKGYHLGYAGGNRTTVRRSIILKRHISRNERGALLVLFENELMSILSSDQFHEIEKMYQILFLPSWQPIYSVPLLLLASKATMDFFVMSSIIDDMAICDELSDFCVSLPFHAASWVSERFYSKEKVDKNIDIIMVANFNKYKRHWKFFEALRELPQHLVVVLAGVPIKKRTKNSIMKEAKAFGVERRIKVVEKASDEVLADMISRAKIMLALSHKEGPFISVVESLMANTPVGMYVNAMIGSKAYINDKTGFLFDPNEKLAPQILAFLERSHSFTPYVWAKNYISSRQNVKRLNTILRDYSVSKGYEWSMDIENFYCRHFDFYYDRGVDAESDFDSLYREFRQQFGLIIKRPEASAYKTLSAIKCQ